MTYASALQELHDSEINAGIQSFFDCQWSAWIGDEMNGIKSENDGLSSYLEATQWLADEARRLYPDSRFAKRWPSHRGGGDG